MEKPGFHYTANATTTTQKQSDYKVEQSSFTLIALFCLENDRCRGRNWLNRNQAKPGFTINNSAIVIIFNTTSEWLCKKSQSGIALTLFIEIVDKEPLK